MRVDYSKVLKLQFQSKLLERFPEFEKAAAEFGGVVYRRSISGGYSVFVFLLPSPQMQRFTVELAVAPGGSFPFNVLHGEVGPQGELRCRIRSLTQLTGDGWWYVEDSLIPDTPKSEEEASREQINAGLARIPALVESVIDHLKVAIPMLIHVQQPHG